ncbi:MAG TPA: GntR family transcriptional regulator [Solirubrobacteraceae bacterium]|nr:GntR family transcriptional regulator [Solirubrobacteraceae bacterium]
MSPGRSARAPEAKPTKQQQVYDVIRERILGGAYSPGFRVVIDALAAEFGVSALPVREAIRRLEAEGLVVYRANAGAQVAPADPGLFEDELTVVAVLEGYVTALAAPHLEAADLDQLRKKTDEMVAAMERMDALSFGRHNQEFHEIVYAHCPNQALVDMVHEVGRRLDAIRRTVFTHIPYRGAKSIAEHRELIDLLARGARPDRIEAAARAHKLGTVESFRAWRREHGDERSAMS